MPTAAPYLWYRDKDVLKIGQVNRYRVRYTRLDSSINQIYFRLKNIERPPIRAIHLINGPFILYCHVIPRNYNARKKFHPDNLEFNKEVRFNNDIKPGESFKVILNLNENSRVTDEQNGTESETETETESEPESFEWEIDIISQIVINRKGEINYDFMIGDDMQKLKKLSHMNSLQYTLTSLSTGGASAIEIDKLKERELNHSINPQLVVEKKSTDEIWNEPPRDPTHPIHLIIVTHGIFSNLTADLLYVRDTLMNNSSENVLIRGYAGNAGKTERGVKKLGKNMGKYLIEYIEHECPYKIEKISFLGHSLGGLVQLYAIRYILLTKGITWFNDHKIQPQNLIFLASPLLGILNEISFFLSWFLDLGTLGKTGRDLTLSKRFLSLKSKRETSDDMSLKPILEILPDSPLQEFLGKFKKLTIYANAVNDGIVPLRTAALLYLDYEALGDVNEIKKHHPVNTHSSSSNASIQTNTSTNTITEVPEDDDTNGEGEGKKLKNQSVNKIRAIGDILNLNLGWKPSHSSTASRKLTSRERKFLRISAKGIDSDSIRQYENDDDYEEDDIGNTTIVSDGTASTTTNTEPALNIPPRANVVESALNAIICPVPSTNFIMNPESRNAVIFHDKYYKFENLPKPENEKDEEHKFLFTWTLKHDWKLKKQVRIARKYHTGELNWRKILVHLPPDAHNNIIVRRRFANGYGWGVIDHVCENLFMSDRLSQNGHGKLHDKPQDNEVVKAKM